MFEVSLVYINSVKQSLQSTNVTLSFSVLKSGHTENQVALLVCSTSKVFKRQKRKINVVLTRLLQQKSKSLRLSLDQSFSPVLPSSAVKIFRVEETKTVSHSEKLLLHARVYL